METQKPDIEANFSWVLEGKLAGCSLPGNYPSPLEQDLRFLGQEKGVTAIVSLTPQALDEGKVNEAGMKTYVHIPVEDYYPPSQEQMKQFAEIVDQNEATVVHCNAGRGRTGTMLAAYLVLKKGMTGEEAIAFVKNVRKTYIQTNKQEDALKQLYASITASTESTS
ncbi:Dual specificity protein phosphatase 23 [Balamuthia mandrillaris]